MDTKILTDIGLSENEIKIYLNLLKCGSSTAYEISKKTGIYRVHVYDKLEQLMDKGLVSHVYKGAKKHFQATHPSKIKQYLEDKRKELDDKESELNNLMPQLISIMTSPKDDTLVEVFKGLEGIKYFLKDIVKTGEEVLISGVDDKRYQENLSVYMKQYFRDLKKNKINERILTIKKDDLFTFSKKHAPTTKYKFLDSDHLNPTNTFVYGNKVVILTWTSPPAAIMIVNSDIARTYKDHFEHLWAVADEKL